MKIGFVSLISACALSWLIQDHSPAANSIAKSEFAVTASLADETVQRATGGSEAAHNAAILEEVAALALATLAANPKTRAISKHLHDKHFLRKHGRTAYYGQST